jgi:ABC-2 type transport system permease protein
VTRATAFAAVVGAELRQWRRQRLAVASSLVFPVLMAALVSSALGGEMPDFTFTFAVVDHEHGVASEAFVEQALGNPRIAEVVDTRLVTTDTAARGMLEEGTVDAVVVLPADLGARLTRPGDVGIELDADNPLAADIGAMVIDQYAVQARATALALAGTGAAPTRPWPLRVELSAPGGQRLDAARHYGPGIGMFFVLVGLGFAAQRHVADRRRGLTDRMAATPASPVAVAVGRSVASLLIGGLSLGTTAAAMQLLFGRSWGHLVPVVALLAATVIAFAGVAALIAGLSRTPEQAAILGSSVAFVFALASGTFSPPGSIAARPAFAELVPTTHALDAFAQLATEPSGIAAITGPLVVLCGFGLAGWMGSALVARWARS